MNKITEAREFASSAHRGQFRKWSNKHVPYITHPVKVAEMVAITPKATEDMVIAGLCHDLLEDTTITREDISIRFGAPVLNLVLELTNTSKATGLSRSDRKRLDRERLALVSPEAKLIKLCDRLDNLRDILADETVPDDYKDD
jgi:(p)ppGpp synthase/HD superfamily hydrolase